MGDYRLRIWHVAAGLLVLAVGSCQAYDYGSRYQSWSNLSKKELVESARWYVRERAPGQKVCLYAVTCDKGRPRLVLVKDVNAWDIEAARQLAWDRRFKDYCPGYTANFALEVAEGGPEIVWERKRAVWSFYLDRFTPRMGRFHGPHAFSEKEAEPCTAEHAVAG
ncbi:MAG: hypothetical protein NBV60_03510 [Erythrobacter sp.]|nr:hypothetical protein [Erythrobacter sp.]